MYLVASQERAPQLKAQGIREKKKSGGQPCHKNQHFLYGRHLMTKLASKRSSTAIARKKIKWYTKQKEPNPNRGFQTSAKGTSWVSGLRRCRLTHKARSKNKACTNLLLSLLGLCSQNNYKLCWRTLVVCHNRVMISDSLSWVSLHLL